MTYSHPVTDGSRTAISAAFFANPRMRSLLIGDSAAVVLCVEPDLRWIDQTDLAVSADSPVEH